MENDNKNIMKSMTKSHFTDSKLDKSEELNSSMTIVEKEQDEYTKTIHNIGGRK